MVGYSRNYLDGVPGQGRFPRRLCRTLAPVVTLILVVDLARASWAPTAAGKPHPLRLVLALADRLVARFWPVAADGRGEGAAP